MSAELDVRGLKEAQKETEKMIRDLHGPPVIQAMRDGLMAVQRDAKRGAPVYQGKLRASITPEITADDDETVGVIGSNLIYAPFMELGTRPHWPPIAALETWARRHGTSAFLVARAIALRGTKARKFLQKAIERNANYIYRKLSQAVDRIMRG